MPVDLCSWFTIVQVLYAHYIMYTNAFP